MKAILEFNLPEEREEHYYALNGSGYYCIINDIFQRLRQLSKYEDKEVIDIDELRDLIRESADNYEVKLD